MLNINYIYKCSFFNPKIGSKRCSIASLCRLPIPSADEFEFFFKQIKSNYGINYSKESISKVVIGDFNVRLSKWWTDNKIT